MAKVLNGEFQFFRKSTGIVGEINSEFLWLRYCFRKVAKINSKFPICQVLTTPPQAMHMVSRRMKQLQAQALSVINDNVFRLIDELEVRNEKNLSPSAAIVSCSTWNINESEDSRCCLFLFNKAKIFSNIKHLRFFLFFALSVWMKWMKNSYPRG